MHGHFVSEEGIPVLTEKLRKIFYAEGGGYKQKELLSKSKNNILQASAKQILLQGSSIGFTLHTKTV